MGEVSPNFVGNRTSLRGNGGRCRHRGGWR